MVKSLAYEHSDRVGDGRNHNRHTGFADPAVDLLSVEITFMSP